MDFNQAIAAHSSWKMKLANYLKKPDKSLQPGELGMDNKCDLGKWLAGEGIKYASFPEFVMLKAEHTHFHRAAADIVRRANAGEVVSEEVVLGAKSEFVSASTAVVQALMKLKSRA